MPVRHRSRKRDGQECPSYGERPMLLQQVERIGFRQFAQRQPHAAGRGQQPCRRQQMQLRSQRREQVRLLRRDDLQVRDVVQHQQNVTERVEPLAQAGLDRREVRFGSLPFLVADLVAEQVAQMQGRVTQARLTIAGDQKPASRIRAGERVGVGERQLGLADPAQAMHAADHSGAVVLQPLSQVEQFVQAAGEPLVVRRHGAETVRRQPHSLGAFVEIASQSLQHAPQIVAPQGVDPLLLKRLHEIGRDLPPVTHLPHHGCRRGDEVVSRLRQPTQFTDLPRDFMLVQHHLLMQASDLADDPRHLDEIDCRSSARQNVLGDLGVSEFRQCSESFAVGFGDHCQFYR